MIEFFRILFKLRRDRALGSRVAIIWDMEGHNVAVVRARQTFDQATRTAMAAFEADPMDPHCQDVWICEAGEKVG